MLKQFLTTASFITLSLGAWAQNQSPKINKQPSFSDSLKIINMGQMIKEPDIQLKGSCYQFLTVCKTAYIAKNYRTNKNDTLVLLDDREGNVLITGWAKRARRGHALEAEIQLGFKDSGEVLTLVSTGGTCNPRDTDITVMPPERGCLVPYNRETDGYFESSLPRGYAVPYIWHKPQLPVQIAALRP